jgi:hypothetical protein
MREKREPPDPARSRIGASNSRSNNATGATAAIKSAF